jgi:hypothetical protein
MWLTLNNYGPLDRSHKNWRPLGGRLCCSIIIRSVAYATFNAIDGNVIKRYTPRVALLKCYI